MASPIPVRVGPWHCGGMPAVDSALLPLCVGLTLVGLVITGLTWRRGNRGRVLQGVGLALAPVALYFSGLLRLLWNAVAALVSWVAHMIWSPPVWFGLGLLAFCIVLCGEDYSTESPRAAILAKSDVRAENGTCLTEKILKILPLTMKG